MNLQNTKDFKAQLAQEIKTISVTLDKEHRTIYGACDCTVPPMYTGKKGGNSYFVMAYVDIDQICNNCGVQRDELKEFNIRFKGVNSLPYEVYTNHHREYVGSFTAQDNTYTVSFKEIVEMGYDDFSIVVTEGYDVLEFCGIQAITDEKTVTIDSISENEMMIKGLSDCAAEGSALCFGWKQVPFYVWGTVDVDAVCKKHGILRENLINFNLKLKAKRGAVCNVWMHKGRRFFGTIYSVNNVFTIPYLDILSTGCEDFSMWIYDGTTTYAEFEHEITVEITYRAMISEKNKAYGSDDTQYQIFDIQIPDINNIPEGGYPVVVTLHGGFWYFDDEKKENYNHMESFLHENGCVWVNMNYRLLDKSDFGDITPCEGMLNDIQKVIECVIEDYGKYINPEKIALWGYSAGAHLALLYAYSRNTSPYPIKIKLVIAEAGPTELTSIIEDTKKDNDWGFYVGLVEALTGENYTYPQEGEEFHSDAWDDASPYYHAQKAPEYLKTLLVYGKLEGEKGDGLVPFNQAEMLKEELEKYPKHCMLLKFPLNHDDIGKILKGDNEDVIQEYRAILENLLDDFKGTD